MGRFLKKNKHEVGLGPDALIFRGKQKVDEVLLRVMDFNADRYTEKSLNKVIQILKYKTTDTVTWFNIDGLHNEKVLRDVAECFELDSLVLAEILNTDGRPKLQEYENCIYLSIKMLHNNEGSDKIIVENLSIVTTESVIISFQERPGDVFDPIRERIKNQKKRIRNSGTDYLLFALLDTVIDNYIYILSLLGDKIESLEDKLLNNPNQKFLDEVNNYKRELNLIRKNILPAKDMIVALSKLDSDMIEYSSDVHLKELVDNISLAIDSSETYREILSDQLNIYHSIISSRLNDIIKFLTVFSVIFIPLTFIAGIYGTNFDNIPELHLKYGYFIMWGVMILLVILMLFYFKRKKWL
jgi:magnesium transporter